MQDLDNDDLEYLASQARADHVDDELRKEVERLKVELHNAHVDRALAERDAARMKAKARAQRRRISRIAAIAHTGGLAGLGEGGALNMVRALTVLYMEKSDTRDEQITRLNEAMSAARDESKERKREGDTQ